jgi:nucleotide-binding universal stress UspA family protein
MQTTRFLACVELSDRTTFSKVLDAAVSQTLALEGELTVLSIVPDLPTGIDYRYAIRGETGGSADYDLKAIVANTLERLNEAVAERVPAGMEVQTIVRHGIVYEQVLSVAAEIGAGHIVIGAKSRSIGDFLLGTNAARVVRHASCSVNVIRN